MRGRLFGKSFFNRLNIIKSVPTTVNHEIHHTSSRSLHQCREQRFNAVYQASVFWHDTRTSFIAISSLYIDESENIVQRMT